MSEPRSLHCYEYIERSYENVRGLLHKDATKLLQRATSSAATRSQEILASLHLHVAGIEIGVDVRVFVQRIREQNAASGELVATRLELSWEAAHMPALFPVMLAEVTARPLSPTETQLDVDGCYWPPLGPIGAIIDAVGGHRIAEATVHRFLTDLAAQIRHELAPT
ncbi:MAG TPA: hypothetical protein VEK07_12335 [Polyangiaceae bacterium]|nr:hypothetical protein [Polyangiaceae bacterium]